MEKIITEFINQHRISTNHSMIVALSGCQGSGKSFQAKKVAQSLNNKGFKTVAISIDDFYYSNQKLDEISMLSINPLLQGRGLPGTINIELAKSVLSNLRHGKKCCIPRFDKSLNFGKGGHGEEELCSERIDIIILEGWCIGFRKLNDLTSVTDYLDFKRSDILEINHNLFEFDSLYSFFDIFIYIKPLNISWVLEWRLQQERDSNKSSMNPKQVEDFVSKFLPIYHYYSHQLENGFDKIPTLLLTIDKDRRIVGQKRL